MGQEFETEESIRLAERFKRHAQTMDDFHNEMAGRDVGRVSRFLTAETRDIKFVAKREDEKRSDLTALQLVMMHNKALAEAFRETEKKLRQVQNRLDDTLELVVLAKAETEDRLDGELSAAERAGEEARLEKLEELETDIRAGQAEIGDMQEEMEQNRDEMDLDDFERFQERADGIATDFENRLDVVLKPLEASSPNPAQPDGLENTGAGLDAPKF